MTRRPKGKPLSLSQGALTPGFLTLSKAADDDPPPTFDAFDLFDVEVVAVCDVARVVDYSRQEFGGIAGRDYALETVKRFNEERVKPGSSSGCTGYEDLCEMFEKESDIDAVVVATPDHVHAAACMAAISRGKHVYVRLF